MLRAPECLQQIHLFNLFALGRGADLPALKADFQLFLFLVVEFELVLLARLDITLLLLLLSCF